MNSSVDDGGGQHFVALEDLVSVGLQSPLSIHFCFQLSDRNHVSLEEQLTSARLGRSLKREENRDEVDDSNEGEYFTPSIEIVSLLPTFLGLVYSNSRYLPQ